MSSSFSVSLPVPTHCDASALIVKHCQKALSHVPPPYGSGNLSSDIGTFISKSIQYLDVLAEGLIEGQHMDADTVSAIEELERTNDLSDVDNLDPLIEVRRALGEMSRCLHRTSKEIRRLWDEIPPPPARCDDYGKGLTKNQGSEIAFAGLHLSPQPQPEHRKTSLPLMTTSRLDTSRLSLDMGREPFPRAESVSSVDSQIPTTSREFNLLQMVEALKGRGKGCHTCPFGNLCKKGGYRDGAAVIFTRNADFRTHLEKHMKRFVCRLPNCPTRKGFARRDQLLRHQEKVSHAESM